MKLMTKKLLDEIPQLYATEEVKGFDKICYVRFFHPGINWTWYACEFSKEEQIFYGYVCGDENEWGYFSLAELEQNNVERDLHFSKKPLSEALKDDGNKQNF
jgi:hypothetical protein